MNPESALQTARSLLSAWAESFSAPEGHRLDVTLTSEQLLPAAEKLVAARWGYLSAITGLDHGPESGEMEALYHFCEGGAIVTLRAGVARHAPVLPSVCGLLPHATLYERELIEMFGFELPTTPNPDRLFLPDDWPSGVYPLRKDFKTEMSAPVGTGAPVGTSAPVPTGTLVGTDPSPLSEADLDSMTPTRSGNKFYVPIGPQHPALKEPGHFEFTVDGETVTGAKVRLGYVHRGIERATEERSWVQNLYLLERICGICSHTHALAYVLGVEKLAGVEAPPRAQAIRELVAGLERIHSHLLWVGVAAHEAGFDTLFMYSWRDRETVMDLLEGLSGNRVNYSANVLGGVKCEVDTQQAERIRAGLDYLERRTHHYLEVVSTDAAFLQRTRGIGITTAEQAEAWGLVGPTARASGASRDIRVDAPYGAYLRFPVSVVKEKAGDLEAKFIVRIKELFVTYAAIRSILDGMPDGELTARMPRKIPAGEVISRVEAPRGELLYFIQSAGGERPARVKVRTPSICNFASVAPLVIGHQLADVPLILAGIDPCFSCNDRLITIRRSDGSQQLLSWDQLRRIGTEKRPR